MKRTLLLFGALFVTTLAGAQQIASADATLDDVRFVLERAGFETYAYDLSQFLDGDTCYDVAFRVREYVAGKPVDGDQVFHAGRTRMLLSDYPEQARAEIPDSVLLDPERGIVRESARIVFGRYPSGADSVAQWAFSLENAAKGSFRLELEAQKAPDSDTRFYSYYTRPFVMSRFESGRFIPLLFFGSMWYDARFGFFRFCGEKVIDPDLSKNQLVEHVPHFYVLGVELTAMGAE